MTADHDNAIRDDLIIGREPILAILKLSHWKYMEPYLAMPDCPITQVGRRWMTRRSLLNEWLTKIMTIKAQASPQAQAA